MVLTWSSLFAFIGSFMIVGVWVYFYLEKRKVYFLVAAIIVTIVEGYYWYSEGLRLSSFKNFFSSIVG